VGVGADLVHVPRLAEALARHPGFAARVFTSGEIAYCERHREPAPRYAARFAAKEAVLKALGTGLARGMRWQDVEIVAGPNRQPLVRLHGEVAAAARARGVQDVQVSLSHDGEYALAFAVTLPLGPAESEEG
jgi:holo-[acyl-carrier protein] synthase